MSKVTDINEYKHKRLITGLQAMAKLLKEASKHLREITGLREKIIMSQLERFTKRKPK